MYSEWHCYRKFLGHPEKQLKYKAHLIPRKFVVPPLFQDRYRMHSGSKSDENW
jgi:hypothetical protein